MSRIALLDVNVLVALFDPDHVHHEPAHFSIRDLRSVKGHALANKQITDVYLLALARHRNGRLATFDRSIPLGGIEGATSRHLEIIPA